MFPWIHNLQSTIHIAMFPNFRRHIFENLKKTVEQDIWLIHCFPKSRNWVALNLAFHQFLLWIQFQRRGRDR